VHNYLNTFALYLLSALSLKNNQSERSVAFISLGEIAVAVGGSIPFYSSFYHKITVTILIHKAIFRFCSKRD
jgi:hypothetical protein